MREDEKKTSGPLAFEEYFNVTAKTVNGHNLHSLVLSEDYFQPAREAIALCISDHYTFSDRMARLLNQFGKEKAAAYLESKLPQTPKIRSGDLGEIIATEYIDSQLSYKVPIKRLRWKDHREMAMRGDDVIGISFPDGGGPLRFLKSEVKSRKSLSTAVIGQARQALNEANGLPSPHSIGFISDRLYEEGQEYFSDKLILEALENTISKEQVQHLLFTISGNPPYKFLNKDLENYQGTIRQNAVGLHITKHQEFIASVYQTLESDHEP